MIYKPLGQRLLTRDCLTRRDIAIFHNECAVAEFGEAQVVGDDNQRGVVFAGEF